MNSLQKKKVGQTATVSRTCRCVKSACSKSYCICYKDGVNCKEACLCVGCENGKSSTTPIPKARKSDTPAITTAAPKAPVVVAQPKPKQTWNELLDKSKEDYSPDCCFSDAFITNNELRFISRRLLDTIGQCERSNVPKPDFDKYFISKSVNYMKAILTKVDSKKKKNVAHLAKCEENPLPAFEKCFERNVFVRYVSSQDSAFFKSLSSETVAGPSIKNEKTQLLQTNKDSMTGATSSTPNVKGSSKSYAGISKVLEYNFNWSSSESSDSSDSESDESRDTDSEYILPQWDLSDESEGISPQYVLPDFVLNDMSDAVEEMQPANPPGPSADNRSGEETSLAFIASLLRLAVSPETELEALEFEDMDYDP